MKTLIALIFVISSNSAFAHDNGEILVLPEALKNTVQKTKLDVSAAQDIINDIGNIVASINKCSDVTLRTTVTISTHKRNLKSLMDSMVVESTTDMKNANTLIYVSQELDGIYADASACLVQ